jgi:aspartate racemase
MAANVALELAQLLLSNGDQVPLLVLIDQPGPDIDLSRRDWLYWQWAAISHLSWRQRWQYIANAVRFRCARSTLWPSIIRRLFFYRKHSDSSFGGDNIAAAEHRRRMMDATLEALRTYHPRPYPEHIALFRAESSSPRLHCDAKGGWGSIALGGIQVVEIPGHHMNIFEPPNVSVFAEKLKVLCRQTR